MKTEYLITFDSNTGICTDVKKFKKLLSAHEDIQEFKDGISYKGNNYPWTVATDKLPDDSVYYDLTLTLDKPEVEEELQNFNELLRTIRSVCGKNGEVTVLLDGGGQFYCEAAYPIIYEVENLMRKLIFKFMAISKGKNWHRESVPQEVTKSIREKEGSTKSSSTSTLKEDDAGRQGNFLFKLDFIQLSSYLVKEYTTNKGSVLDFIKGKSETEQIKISDIKPYIPFTNWEKYFSTKVSFESSYLASRWEKLYEYRCSVAHSRVLHKNEFDDLVKISGELRETIQQALNSLNDLHIPQEERESLAENISGVANTQVASFIATYNKLVNTLRAVCELVSEPNDTYQKVETNKTNIKMQANYLSNAKGVFDRETARIIENAQRFRNLVVHDFGLANIDESQINNYISDVNTVLNDLMGYSEEELTAKKGVDLRVNRSEQ